MHVAMPIPKEVAESLAGFAEMRQDIAEIRDLLKRLVELQENTQ